MNIPRKNVAKAMDALGLDAGEVKSMRLEHWGGYVEMVCTSVVCDHLRQQDGAHTYAVPITITDQ